MESSLISFETKHSQIASCWGNHSSVAILTDTHCWALYKHWLQRYIPAQLVHCLPVGEQAKTLTSYTQAIEQLASSHIRRTSSLVAFGGGCVLDASGFIASTYLRGIDLYFIPTTLLAMVDAAIGGKNALNLAQGKNLVGTFYAPKQIMIDPYFLHTLPQHFFNEGIAELIKMGLIGCTSLWEAVQKPLSDDSPHLLSIIQDAVAFKTSIVEQDPDERQALTDDQPGRKILNFGHTFAHAIEAATQYQVYRHGEAVAIGLVLALRLSEQYYDLSPDYRDKLETILAIHQLPNRLKEPLPISILMEALKMDKKIDPFSMQFILLKDFGQAVITRNIQPTVIEHLWQAAMP